MTSKSRDESFDGPTHQSAPDSQFSSPNELITFAQGYFASDFPNPEGLDCPIKGTLSGFVRSGKAPDNRLRSHLFGCSECFGQYRNALAAYREDTKEMATAAYPPNQWWTKIIAAPPLRPVPIFICALLLILLGSVGLVLVEHYSFRGSHKKDLLARPATEGASPSPVMTADRSSPEPSPKQASQQNAPVSHPRMRPPTRDELIAMSIDLRDYTMTRGGAVSGGEIKLSLRRTRLMLKLPEGSARGLYALTVANESGSTLETRKVTSTDGKTLTATLNLQRLAPGNYGLRISREGEPPIDVPILVNIPTGGRR
jgi:hypothetical protein